MRRRKDSLGQGSQNRAARGPRTHILSAPRLALLGIAGIAALFIWSPAFAIPFLHVAGDGDGDHVVDGADGAPAVYCGTSHADVNSNGAVQAVDVAITRGAFLQELPVNPLTDQNHNDAGDRMDVAVVLTYFGGTTAVACTSAVADPIPPTGIGATAGAVLSISAPAAVGGDINPAVFTAGATDPYRGYSAMIHFDETVVAAVSGTNAVAGWSCDDVIDNSDDAVGPDGFIIIACNGSAVAAAGTLATFNFDVLAAGDPALCIRAFTAGDGGPLRGTYTFGADIGPQVQMLSDTCGLGVAAADSDGDGCTNTEEDEDNPAALGGMRNPLFPYDFYDVNGNENVNAVDIALVRANFSAPAPTPPEDEIYDRSVGVAPWAPGAPNDIINAIDIALVRASFNHSCVAPP